MHTNRESKPYTRFVFHTLRQLQPDLIPQRMIYQKTARETGIHSRFKSFIHRANKASIFEETLLINSHVQKRKRPLKKNSFEKRMIVCVGLIGIKAVTYDFIDTPARVGISFWRA